MLQHQVTLKDFGNVWKLRMQKILGGTRNPV